jgi:hypothetical protein
VRRFNGAESNAHSGGSRIGHVPQGNERRSAVVNPYSDLRSPRKGSRRFDKAAKDAQITGERPDLLFGLHIHDFRPGRKWVARRAMLFHLHQLKYEPLCPAPVSNSRLCVVFCMVGTARTCANILGERKAASLPREALDEEKETDQRLTVLAETVNVRAAAARASD